MIIYDWDVKTVECLWVKQLIYIIIKIIRVK